jgi:type IV secretory pathway VirJ component
MTALLLHRLAPGALPLTVYALAMLTLVSGCSTLPAPSPSPSPSPSPVPSAPQTRVARSAAPKVSTTLVMLHGQPLELHVAAPAQATATAAAANPIVLYASGDGGWFGAAVDMFKQIADAGFPVVGFSSKAFLKIQRPHGGLVNATQLAADYEAIVTQARAALGQSDSSGVVLTGWSRGAGFAVLAASVSSARANLAGIIAIGLGPGEDLTVTAADDDGSDDGAGDDDGQPNQTGGSGQFDTYATIARLGPLACAVIQASHDNYLPAAAARKLFGPDTDRRRLYAIDARNHRFTGGKAAFNAALIDALNWIVSTASSSSTSAKRDS